MMESDNNSRVCGMYVCKRVNFEMMRSFFVVVFFFGLHLFFLRWYALSRMDGGRKEER